ncbi:hypothetical protein TNIN_492101 [Trichonephila inaurata madagascariensis]|uniref:Uncharacterized protein n=1 Tax=Trichonephila inaurata madagascariensis TaxID=2747483 RepID=A0A8X6Y9Y9_9ARAC|nr:hypothetical protein TNIN_492101 [Trichonephila inaurata madagascariensis]
MKAPLRRHRKAKLETRLQARLDSRISPQSLVLSKQQTLKPTQCRLEPLNIAIALVVSPDVTLVIRHNTNEKNKFEPQVLYNQSSHKFYTTSRATSSIQPVEPQVPYNQSCHKFHTTSEPNFLQPVEPQVLIQQSAKVLYNSRDKFYTTSRATKFYQPVEPQVLTNSRATSSLQPVVPQVPYNQSCHKFLTTSLTSSLTSRCHKFLNPRCKVPYNSRAQGSYKVRATKFLQTVCTSFLQPVCYKSYNQMSKPTTSHVPQAHKSSQLIRQSLPIARTNLSCHKFHNQSCHKLTYNSRATSSGTTSRATSSLQPVVP